MLRRNDPLIDRQGAMLERIEFERRVEETGIARHLSNEALMLMFLALGSRMWRKP